MQIKICACYRNYRDITSQFPQNLSCQTQHFTPQNKHIAQRPLSLILTWKGAADERAAIRAAITAARPPTTMPCTWMRARLATPMSTVFSAVSRCPRLAWVDSLQVSRIFLRKLTADLKNSEKMSFSSFLAFKIKTKIKFPPVAGLKTL